MKKKSAQIVIEPLTIKSIVFNSIQLEVQLLNNYRQFFNPNKFSREIEKAYRNNQLLQLIRYITLYSYNSVIFYFLPLWFLMFPFYFLSNLKIWRATWLKISFSISEYRTWTKNSLTSNFQGKGAINFKIVISFFPFIFGISYIIYSRYQNQVFSYFIQENLPGAYPSYPKITWETFQHIISSQLKLDSNLLSKAFLQGEALPNQTVVMGGNSDNSHIPLTEKVSFSKPDLTLSSAARAVDQPGFIQQLDFYSDSFLLKFNSNWESKKKQIYLGIFPKKNSLGHVARVGNPGFSRNKNFFRNSQTRVPYPGYGTYQIGNNWHLISPKDFMTFCSDSLLSFKSVSQENHVAETENLIRSKILNLSVNLDKNSTNKSHFFNNQPNYPGSLPGLRPIGKNYWDVFYLNLDELPKKLTSINTNFNFPGQNKGKDIPLLPIKKYLFEYQQFLLNTSANHTKNSHNNLVVNRSPGREPESGNPKQKLEKLKNENLHNTFKFVKFNFLEIVNTGAFREGKHLITNNVCNLEQEVNFDSRNKIAMQTLEGFANRYSRHLELPPKLLNNHTLATGVEGFKKASLPSDSILFNKIPSHTKVCEAMLRIPLLQNELRQYFYNSGLKPLPNFLSLESEGRLLADDFGFSLEREILKTNNEVGLENLNEEQLDFSSKLEDYCSEQIVQILQDFAPFQINLAIQPRVMSGYQFPDTSHTELRSLILQSFYHNKFSFIKNLVTTSKIKNECKFFSPALKVGFSPTFTSYLAYPYSNPKVPTFKLNYRPTFLEGVKKTLYQGPGVLRENLTQDLNLTNKDEIRKWIKPFLSAENPLTDQREIFFGQNLIKLSVPSTVARVGNPDDLTLQKQRENYQTPSLNQQASFVNNALPGFPTRATTHSPSTQKQDQPDFLELEKVKKHITRTKIRKVKTGQNKSAIKTKSRSVNLPILPFTQEFQVPYLTKLQWHTILERLKAHLEEQLEDKTELEKKLKVNVPLIRVRNPKQQKIHWPLNQLDYQNLNNFVFSLQNNLFNKSSQFSFFNIGLPQGKNQSSLRFEDISYRDVKDKQKENNLTQINYHYVPSAQIVLNENLTQKRIFGNVYRKSFTVYQTLLENKYECFNPGSLPGLRPSKRKNYAKNTFPLGLWQGQRLNNFNTAFYQSWEPITPGSWMMITQLSFGLVVLQILQDFYRKYGKELISYVFDLLASLGIMDDSLKEELEIDDRRKGFRLIRQVQKRFRDIAGIDSILPELGEIVWFLRNSGRSFKVGNIIPKGILLVGSPGTGKTLLVQAIAGEAEVPVLVQSGSSLNDPEQEGGGAQKLKILFEQARQMAPCIVFIDEIDTLGERRENVIQNPMGTDEVIESIQEQNESEDLPINQFIPKPKIKFSKNQSNILEGDSQNLLNYTGQEEGAFTNLTENSEFSENSNLGLIQQSIDKQEAKQEQLRLLMQFLIEMDGLRARKGVIVIGATNRPDVLDLALTRPGRFDQILQLGLPEKQKRIDILKLYSKNLGTESTISWDYLANRTVGFSAADLAAVMNESSMKAILSETIHTIQTIEQGIESITSYSSERTKVEITTSVDPFFISRLAYYQAGKAVIHTLLLHHPSVTVLHLWPRQKNARHTYISAIIQNKFLKISRKLELESRVVGLYAGKAAEFLILSMDNISETQKLAFDSKKLWQSDIGSEDLNFATSLVQSMINKWYFYSKDLVVRRSNQIVSERNRQEIQELDTIDLLNQVAIKNETEIIQKTRFSGLNRDFQKWSIRPWWQTQVTHQIGFLDPAYAEWYRIYLPDPEESERNEEWLPPDEYYHNNSNLSDLRLDSNNSSVNWNDLYATDRDYIYHGLLLTCFNTAFTILDKNRELLDYFASYLMRNDILREHEITKILSQFKPDIIFDKKRVKEQQFLREKSKKPTVIEKSWGHYSRRKVFRFLNFDSILSKL
jgi:ATP-dependent Zn protease